MSEAGMREQVLDNFWSDTPSPLPIATTEETEVLPEIVDKQVDKNSQLRIFQTDECTEREAKNLQRRAYTEASNLYETLTEIHDRKAWKHLGQTSFDGWYKQFCANAQHVMHLATFYRKRAYDRCRIILLDAGREVTGLTQQSAYPLMQDITEQLIPETWDLARQESEAYKPVGEALKHWFPGKVLPSHVETAKARIMQRISSEVGSDPYADEHGGAAAALPAVFDATDDGRIVVDMAMVTDRPDYLEQAQSRPVAPMPTAPIAPPVVTTTTTYAPSQKPISAKPLLPVAQHSVDNEERVNEHCYVFLGLEESPLSDVVFVQGDDGSERGIIPVQIPELINWLRKRNRI